MFSYNSNKFIITCSIEPISGKTELKTDFIRASVIGENRAEAEKAMFREISAWIDDVKSGKITLTDRKDKQIYEKLTEHIEKGGLIEDLFKIEAVFAPSCSDCWTTTKESYKKYGLRNLIGNNICTFVFLLALAITFFCSPKSLTGTAYIAVFSLCMILIFLSATAILSSLAEFYTGRSSFIERRADTPVIFKAERLHKNYSVSTAQNIREVSVSENFITLKANVVKKLYDSGYRLIGESKSDQIVLPRIYGNEESLFEYLNSLKELNEDA